MEVLVVIDMQRDFIDGSLGTKEAVAIVPAVAKKIKEWEGAIIYTRDTHYENYLETSEGKHLPVVHCIKGSLGHEIAQELMIYEKENAPIIIDKPSFGSTQLPDTLGELVKNACEELTGITLVGLCTDICVVSNAMILKANYPEVPIYVDSSCCAGVTVQTHQEALDVMRCCQIEIL